MATTHFLTTSSADFPTGDNWNVALSAGPPPSTWAGTVSSPVRKNATDTDCAFTYTNVPTTSGITGDYNISAVISTGTDLVFLSIQLNRINSGGVVQTASSATPEQQATAGLHEFNMYTINLGTWSAGDRLRVDFILRNTDTKNELTIDFQADSTGTRVQAPWTESIGGTVLNPTVLDIQTDIPNVSEKVTEYPTALNVTIEAIDALVPPATLYPDILDVVADIPNAFGKTVLYPTVLDIQTDIPNVSEKVTEYPTVLNVDVAIPNATTETSISLFPDVLDIVVDTPNSLLNIVSYPTALNVDVAIPNVSEKVTEYPTALNVDAAIPNASKIVPLTVIYAGTDIPYGTNNLGDTEENRTNLAHAVGMMTPGGIVYFKRVDSNPIWAYDPDTYGPLLPPFSSTVVGYYNTINDGGVPEVSCISRAAYGLFTVSADDITIANIKCWRPRRFILQNDATVDSFNGYNLHCVSAASNGFSWNAGSTGWGSVFARCYAESCGDVGFLGNSRYCRFTNCVAINNQGDGFRILQSVYGVTFFNCIAHKNTGHGFYYDGESAFSHCAATYNGGTGFYAATNTIVPVFINCIAYQNTGWGWHNNVAYIGGIRIYCGAYGNGSGAVSTNMAFRTEPKCLTSDPLFIDPNPSDPTQVNLNLSSTSPYKGAGARFSTSISSM